MLTYLDAILRDYNRYGRRDNKYKARIKILVKDLTPAGFAEQVEAEWAHLKDGPGTLIQEEIDRVARQFTRPAYDIADPVGREQEKAQLDVRLAADRAFARWVERNVQAHRVAGYAAVTLSLKKTGVPGEATAEQMDAVATWRSVIAW
jgi:sulfite reductase (NADPH) hemoprotein beta-component